MAFAFCFLLSRIISLSHTLFFLSHFRLSSRKGPASFPLFLSKLEICVASCSLPLHFNKTGDLCCYVTPFNPMDNLIEKNKTVNHLIPKSNSNFEFGSTLSDLNLARILKNPRALHIWLDWPEY